MHTGSFDRKDSIGLWKSMIDVNVTHVAMMSNLFLPQLLARGGKRSGLINVSSQFGYFQGGAGAAVYCATKGYVNFFTCALAGELADKPIDVQCMTPGLTHTNLLGENSNKPGALSPRTCVEGSLRDLGSGEILTAGNIKHDIQIFPIAILSKLSIVQYGMAYIMGNHFYH